MIELHARRLEGVIGDENKSCVKNLHSGRGRGPVLLVPIIGDVPLSFFWNFLCSMLAPFVCHSATPLLPSPRTCPRSLSCTGGPRSSSSFYLLATMALRSLSRAGVEMGGRVAGKGSRGLGGVTHATRHLAGAERKMSSFVGEGHGQFGRSQAPSYRQGACFGGFSAASVGRGVHHVLFIQFGVVFSKNPLPLSALERGGRADSPPATCRASMVCCVTARVDPVRY